MNSHHYTVKIHRATAGGYWAEVPALPGCFTEAESLEEVTALVREAMEGQLAALLRRGEPFPHREAYHAQLHVPGHGQNGTALGKRRLL